MDDRRAIRVSVLAGLANVGAIFGTALFLRPGGYVGGPAAYAIGVGIGATVACLLGAGPVYLLLRHRLVAPLLASGWITFVAVTERGALHSPIEVFFIPLFAVIVGAVVAVIAMVEYGLRRGVGFALSRARAPDDPAR